MHTEYRISALRELRDQQVRFAPREKKIEQAIAAEKLLAEIEPDRIYTYEYVCYRVTRFRPQAYENVTFDGRVAKHDLALLVEDLSDAANLAVDSVGEQVITIEELAQRFNVSTKTISRWRQLGLISRRFVMDGRKRVGFLQSSVDRFVAENSDKVRRGGQFSQISEEERLAIIVRARRLAQAGGSPAEVVRRIARKTGRSPEAVRYTLKQFDMEHEESAIFPFYRGPLDAETKRNIYYRYHEGESARQSGPAFRPDAGQHLPGHRRGARRSRSLNCRWTISPTSSFPGPCGCRSASSGFARPCRPATNR